jgi:glutaredoxin
MGNLIDVPGIEVDLLWWQGCPSTDHALALVRGALDELGLNSVQIRMVEIETDEQARELGFRGSPTILINGVDVITLVGGTAINEDLPGVPHTGWAGLTDSRPG